MRVLVVEDQAELADDIADGLRDQGIGADVAYDGPAGIEKALISSYDVLILDRDLPKVHGDAVCATLAGSGSAARILMLTAANTVGDRVQGLNLGADDYRNRDIGGGSTTTGRVCRSLPYPRPRCTVLPIPLTPVARRAIERAAGTRSSRLQKSAASSSPSSRSPPPAPARGRPPHLGQLPATDSPPLQLWQSARLRLGR
jgi:CheY-like chemotaxis protein